MLRTITRLVFPEMLGQLLSCSIKGLRTLNKKQKHSENEVGCTSQSARRPNITATVRREHGLTKITS